MFTKRNIIIAVGILIVIGGFFYYRSRSQKETIQTETVKRGDVAETISVIGELVPAEFSDLSFQKAGVVDSVSVSEGDFVKAGQVVASLDSSVLRSQLKEARLAQSIAEEDEALARRNHWKKLAPEERATKKLASERAREDARTIEEQIGERIITAPFDGWISKLDVRAKETATANKTIARVAMAHDFVIEARVPESDITKVLMGMRAKVTFDAFSSAEVFDAEAIEIERSSTIVQDVVFYIVKFRLANTDERLKDGMTANLDIETARKTDVLLVPFRTIAKEGGKAYAEVKRQEGQFEKIEVTLGLEGDEGMVEIKSGLQEGNQVTIFNKQNK